MEEVYVWNFSGQGNLGFTEGIHVILIFRGDKVLKVEGEELLQTDSYHINKIVERIKSLSLKSIDPSDIGTYEMKGNKIKVEIFNQRHKHTSIFKGILQTNGIVGEILKEGYSYEERGVVKIQVASNALFRFYPVTK